jgi:hypothetical protein
MGFPIACENIDGTDNGPSILRIHRQKHHKPTEPAIPRECSVQDSRH